MEKLDLPKTFADAGGRSWTVAITWSTKKRILDVAGLDLNSLIEADGKKGKSPVGPFAELVQDFEALSGVLYAILKPECDKLQPALDLDGFRDAIIGNAVIDARNAFAQALYDFFPDPQKSLLGWSIKTGLAAEKKASSKLEEVAAQMTTAVEAQIDKELAAIPEPAAMLEEALAKRKASQSTATPSTPPSSDVPASAESTPTP